MFGSEIEEKFEFRINWQKPHIINRECQKCVHPDLVDLGDTFYTGPYTDVNAYCILRLQYHQDTYISLCTKIWL